MILYVIYDEIKIISRNILVNILLSFVFILLIINFLKKGIISFIFSSLKLFILYKVHINCFKIMV